MKRFLPVLHFAQRKDLTGGLPLAGLNYLPVKLFGLLVQEPKREFVSLIQPGLAHLTMQNSDTTTGFLPVIASLPFP